MLAIDFTTNNWTGQLVKHYPGLGDPIAVTTWSRIERPVLNQTAFAPLLPSGTPHPMHSSTLFDTDGSSCTLTFAQADGWLRATWRGYVDPVEAVRGAEQYLAHAALRPCPYLLNDNSALRGPWFDSTDWLERVWLPHALRLGLRYIAHVVQADTHADVLTLTFPPAVQGQLELQVFSAVAEAEEWLRSRQPARCSGQAAEPKSAFPLS